MRGAYSLCKHIYYAVLYVDLEFGVFCMSIYVGFT